MVVTAHEVVGDALVGAQDALQSFAIDQCQLEASAPLLVLALRPQVTLCSQLTPATDTDNSAKIHLRVCENTLSL